MTYCAFCAFYRPPGHEEGYVQTYEQIGARARRSCAALDGRQVLLQGGHHPDLTIEWYEGLLRYLKARFPRDQRPRVLAAGDHHFSETFKTPIAEIVAPVSSPRGWAPSRAAAARSSSTACGGSSRR